MKDFSTWQIGTFYNGVTVFWEIITFDKKGEKYDSCIIILRDSCLWQKINASFFSGVCPPGFFSTTGLPPCGVCPENYYWVNETHCQMCPNSGSTLGVNAVKDKDGCKCR